jgi:hypothetical protein
LRRRAVGFWRSGGARAGAVLAQRHRDAAEGAQRVRGSGRGALSRSVAWQRCNVAELQHCAVAPLTVRPQCCAGRSRALPSECRAHRATCKQTNNIPPADALTEYAARTFARHLPRARGAPRCSRSATRTTPSSKNSRRTCARTTCAWLRWASTGSLTGSRSGVRPCRHSPTGARARAWLRERACLHERACSRERVRARARVSIGSLV